MRKQSRKTVIRKLDTIISKIVRQRGYCERCNRTNNLQAAHIYSRSRMSTRFDLKNILCLCPDCHMNFAHKNPLEFAEFVEKFLGEEETDRLTLRANLPRKFEIYELEDLLTRFNDIAKELEG